ncbi:MAG: hypothetical protein ACRDJM_07205, partial [Actinomycetota bacterium]
DLETDAGVDNPKDPDQRIIGVGPDVVHYDNGNSAVEGAYGEVCAGRDAACSTLHHEPSGGGDEGESEPKGR